MLVFIGVYVFLMIVLSAGELITRTINKVFYRYILPLIISLGKLITSLLSFSIKFIIAMVIFCISVLPFLGRGVRKFVLSYSNFGNSLGWHVRHLRDSTKDAVLQQRELMISLWGIILAPLCFIANQIQNEARKTEQYNVDRNVNKPNDSENVAYNRENYMNSENETFKYYYDHNPSYRDNYNNAARYIPRDPRLSKPQRQRLYPSLPDINDNDFDRHEAYNNETGGGNICLNSNNITDNYVNTAWNRQRAPPPTPQRQRLYPSLPDINYDEFDRQEAYNNETGVGNVCLNSNYKSHDQDNGNNSDNELLDRDDDHELNENLRLALLAWQWTHPQIRRN